MQSIVGRIFAEPAVTNHTTATSDTPPNYQPAQQPYVAKGWMLCSGLELLKSGITPSIRALPQVGSVAFRAEGTVGPLLPNNPSLLGFGPGGVEERSILERTRRSPRTSTVLEQEKLVEKVKELLDNLTQSRQGRSVSVFIEPPELGPVMLKVAHRGSQVFAKLSAESPEIEALIKFRLPDLLHSLQVAGIHPRDIHLTVGGEGEGQGNGADLSYPNDADRGKSYNHGRTMLQDGRCTVVGKSDNSLNVGNSGIVGWVV